MSVPSDRSTYLRWLLPASSFRLPVALLPLVIEYAIGSGANFRFASLVVGALGVGELSVVGIVATPLGVRVGRLRTRSTLTLLALADIALVLASRIRPLLWVSLPGALLSGALTALGSGQLREMLTLRLQSQSLQRYLSWDAVALEFAYLLAPLLVSLQVVLLGSHGLLITPAILAIATPLLVGKSPRAVTTPTGAPHLSLRSWLWILSAAEGMVEGMVVVSIVPISTDLIRHPPFGAISMALLSVGSILGGTLYAHLGTRSIGIRPLRRIALLLIGLSGCLIASTLGDHRELFLGGLLFVFGGFIAPINGLRSYAATHQFATHLHGAAFSMVYASYSVGSVGAAITFAILDQTLPIADLPVIAAVVAISIALVYLTLDGRRTASNTAR
ncbi:hypothetical protein [Ferrimicrobium sp.]|uniref:hypothetical protein n=1 Tax=Ferrimicrobium sp. TaxID=2926050 RepID=UPI002616AE4E|nr:hypothetical protein [Ferrimicrobium sp.]